MVISDISTRQGKTRQDKTRQNNGKTMAKTKTREEKNRLDKTRLDKTKTKRQRARARARAREKKPSQAEIDPTTQSKHDSKKVQGQSPPTSYIQDSEHEFRLKSRIVDHKDKSKLNTQGHRRRGQEAEMQNVDRRQRSQRPTGLPGVQYASTHGPHGKMQRKEEAKGQHQQ